MGRSAARDRLADITLAAAHLRPNPAQALPHLDRLAPLFVAALLALIVGLAPGLLAAQALHRANLAWTWSLLSVPAALLAGLIVLALPLGATASIAGTTLLTGIAIAAIARSVDVRLEERRAGGDREAAAAMRRGVLDALRRARVERPRRLAATLADGLPVGRTERGELATIARGSASSGRHVLIAGATGAGKTTSLAALLVDYVVRSGFGAVVLEAKNDATLQRSAAAAAERAGARFHLLSPSGPAGYDPLASGSVDERSERLIAVESWGSEDAAFYRQAASPFLRLVLRTLDRSPEPATLASVARRCDGDELENLAAAVGERELVAEVTASVGALRSDQQRAIAGLRARLQNLASSDFASAWLEPSRAGVRCFDLPGVIARREVAYLRFDTDRTGNVGRAIAQMALLDLGAAASKMMGEGVGTFVAIDEFGALEAPALDRLFARGRAAGFSVGLGTQTLADLRAAGPAVRERVGATISAIVCHRIGEQADAEWVAELIGAVPTWQTTVRTDGLGRPTDEGTRTRGYRFEVNPSQLQRLRPGEAWVARLDESARRARRARVVPPWQRLAQLPLPNQTLDRRSTQSSPAP